MLMGNETNVTEMAMEGNGSGVLDYINKSMWMTMRRCMNMSKIMDENTRANVLITSTFLAYNQQQCLEHIPNISIV